MPRCGGKSKGSEASLECRGHSPQTQDSHPSRFSRVNLAKSLNAKDLVYCLRTTKYSPVRLKASKNFAIGSRLAIATTACLSLYFVKNRGEQDR